MDSSLKRNRWSGAEEYLIRCFESEAFHRSVIQFVHNSVRTFLFQSSEAHSLWELLPYKSVCIFIISTSPRVVRMSEGPLCREPLWGFIIQHEFLCVIARHSLKAFAHGRCRLEYGPGHRGSFSVLRGHNHAIAGLALSEGNNHLAFFP